MHVHTSSLKGDSPFSLALWVPWVPEPDVIGTHLSVQIPGIKCLMWAPTPHSSRKSTRLVRSISIVCLHTWGLIFGKTLSLHLLSLNVVFLSFVVEQQFT